jgi:23S rRNA (adenine2030-N6)-methyltransferase
MNYRHAFHAGNFADVAKHATLLALLAKLQSEPAALTVIDTHAGAGVYDLAGPEASEALQPLKAAVARLNPAGAPRIYPGSPQLLAERLRPGDRLIACEARSDDHAILANALRAWPGAECLLADGWTLAVSRAPKPPARLLVLIDPPYESRDDVAQAAGLVRQILSANRGAVIAVWAPIKDLMGFDTLVGRIEDAARGRPLLIAEARLRPLTDPMRLNGAALLVVNPPAGLEKPAREIAQWVAVSAGEGGEGRVNLAGRP